MILEAGVYVIRYKLITRFESEIKISLAIYNEGSWEFVNGEYGYTLTSGYVEVLQYAPLGQFKEVK